MREKFVPQAVFLETVKIRKKNGQLYMGNMIKVGMADLKVCKCPDALTTLGLGSCVGFEHVAMQTYNGKDAATLSDKFTDVFIA